MDKEAKIQKIDEVAKILKDMRWNELKEDDTIISITKLRILLDDMFGVLKVRKSESLPYIIREK